MPDKATTADVLPDATSGARSAAARGEGGDSAAGGDGYVPPVSASRRDLLDRGSDDRFRRVIYALFVTGARFQEVREAFGREIDVSGPQYFVLMAVASHHPEGGIGIRALADYLHVAPPHVTVEVNKLVARGFLAKRRHPADGRRVVITLDEAGKAALERLAPFRQSLNDILFEGFSREEFRQMAGFFDRFLDNTARALHEVARHETTRDHMNRAAAE